MISIPDNVLWQIFSQNLPEHPVSSLSVSGRYFDTWDGPTNTGFLATAKSTSHVCRGWRRVVEASPNIWSKMLDMTALDTYRQPVQWLKVILQRAQGRNLHIHGTVASVQGMWCFLELVRGCWKRVEILHVRLKVDSSSRNHDFTSHMAWSKIINETSMALRHFYLSAGNSLLWPAEVYHGHMQPPSSKNSSLNLNIQNANVRYLFVQGPTQFSFQPNSPLFQNLRILTISGLAEGYLTKGIEVIFAILEETPALEHLSIGRDAVGEVSRPSGYGQCPQLQLRQLHHLNLEANITVCIAFLLHLSTKSSCRLDLNCIIHDDSEGEIATFHGLVRDWYAKHIVTGMDAQQSLDITLSPFTPHIYLDSRTGGNSFHVGMSFADPDFATILVECLVNDEFNFSAVASLRLTIEHPISIENISLPQIHAFLTKFSQLKILEINWDHFHQFHAKLISLPYPGTIFPCLAELSIFDYGSMSRPGPQTLISAIVEFCKSRRRNTKPSNTNTDPFAEHVTPLKCLNIRWAGSIANDVFMQFVPLEGLDGLQVFYCKRMMDSEGSRCTSKEQHAIIRSGVVTDVDKEVVL